MGATPKAFVRYAPIIFSAHFTAGEAADKQVFTAPMPCRLLKVTETHVTAGAGSSAAMVEKTPSGTAPASGTDLLSTAFALDSTVDTPVEKVFADFVGEGEVSLAQGDSLAIDFSGTVTAYEGVFTFVVLPTGQPSDY